MYYVPETYEWERGDVVCARDFYQVAMRFGDGTWHNSLGGQDVDSFYNDATISKWVKNGTWRYMGNRWKERGMRPTIVPAFDKD